MDHAADSTFFTQITQFLKLFPHRFKDMTWQIMANHCGEVQELLASCPSEVNHSAEKWGEILD
jgi:hypothetical protein